MRKREQNEEDARKQAGEIVRKSIRNCENMQPKFSEGTSQHTLLKNRIRALKTAECLLSGGEGMEEFSDEDLKKALPPILSVIRKTGKARGKYEEGTTQYKRMTPLIDAMELSKAEIEQEILRRTSICEKTSCKS